MVCVMSIHIILANVNLWVPSPMRKGLRYIDEPCSSLKLMIWSFTESITSLTHVPRGLRNPVVDLLPYSSEKSKSPELAETACNSRRRPTVWEVNISKEYLDVYDVIEKAVWSCLRPLLRMLSREARRAHQKEARLYWWMFRRQGEGWGWMEHTIHIRELKVRVWSGWASAEPSQILTPASNMYHSQHNIML